MAQFDVEEEDDPMCRGFTSMSPDELPSSNPSRSLCDNMESQRTITGKARTRNMSNDGGDESKVKAYTEVQYGTKALESDARFIDMPKVGEFKEDGLSVFDNHQPPELYESANGPMDEDDEDDGDERE